MRFHSLPGFSLKEHFRLMQIFPGKINVFFLICSFFFQSTAAQPPPEAGRFHSKPVDFVPSEQQQRTINQPVPVVRFLRRNLEIGFNDQNGGFPHSRLTELDNHYFILLFFHENNQGTNSATEEKSFHPALM